LITVGIEGNYLYFTGDPGFWIYDISSPEEPELVGQIQRDVEIRATELVTCNGYAFLSYRYIVDIHDPENPELIGYNEYSRGRPPRVGRGIDVNEIHAYIADGTGRLTVLDIRDLSQPVVASEYLNAKIPKLIEAKNDFAYLIDRITVEHNRQDCEPLRIFNVENPAQPRFITEVDTIEEDFRQMQIIEEDFLYLTAYGHPRKLNVLSIENPFEPTYPFYEYRGGVYYFVRYENYMYVNREGSGTYIYSIEDLSEPRYIGAFEYIEEPYQRGYAYDVAVDEDFLYVPTSRYGLIIYSLENPEAPEIVSITDLGSTITRAVVRNGYLYGRSGGLKTISVEDPSNPQVVNILEGYGNFDDLFISQEGLLFMAEGDKGIKVLSLENPERPELVAYYDTPGEAIDMALWDNHLYVADLYDFCIFDVAPIQGLWFLGLSAESHVFDSTAVDTISEWELTLSNLSVNEREITDLILDNAVFSCTAETPFAIATESDTTLTIVFSPLADSLYSSTLRIISGDKERTVNLSGRGYLPNSVDDDDTTPFEFALGNTYPNPFNSTTRIDYQLPVSGELSIRVFDLSGREVMNLVEGTHPAGQHSVVWDAERVAAGIYFIRVDCAEFSRVRKVVLVK